MLSLLPPLPASKQSPDMASHHKGSRKEGPSGYGLQSSVQAIDPGRGPVPCTELQVREREGCRPLPQAQTWVECLAEDKGPPVFLSKGLRWSGWQGRPQSANLPLGSPRPPCRAGTFIAPVQSCGELEMGVPRGSQSCDKGPECFCERWWLCCAQRRLGCGAPSRLLHSHSTEVAAERGGKLLLSSSVPEGCDVPPPVVAPCDHGSLVGHENISMGVPPDLNVTAHHTCKGNPIWPSASPVSCIWAATLGTGRFY